MMFDMEDEVLYATLLRICYGEDVHELVLSMRETLTKFPEDEKAFLCEKLLDDDIPPSSVAFYADVSLDFVKEVIRNDYLHYDGDFDVEDPVVTEIGQKLVDRQISEIKKDETISKFTTH